MAGIGDLSFNPKVLSSTGVIIFRLAEKSAHRSDRDSKSDPSERGSSIIP